MRQVPPECDINIAINGCSGLATSTRKGPFMAMFISRSRGTYFICCCGGAGRPSLVVAIVKLGRLGVASKKLEANDTWLVARQNTKIIFHFKSESKV